MATMKNKDQEESLESKKNQDLQQTAYLEKHTQENREEYSVEFIGEDQKSTGQAANQHIERFKEQLQGIDEKAATAFANRYNLGNYEDERRHEMVAHYAEAMNQVEWNNRDERRDASNDIAQSIFNPFHEDARNQEAVNQYQGHDVLDYITPSGEKIQYIVANTPEEAQKLVEESRGELYMIDSAKIQDYERKFAENLYNSDEKGEQEAVQAMNEYLDAAVSIWKGEEPHDRAQEQVIHLESEEPDLEHIKEYEESSHWPLYQQLREASPELRDEILENAIRQKLGSIAGLGEEFGETEHGSTGGIMETHSTMMAMNFTGLRQMVENGNFEDFERVMDKGLVDTTNALSKDMITNNGFIEIVGYKHHQAAEMFTNEQEAQEYAEETKRTLENHKGEMNDLIHSLASQMLSDFEQNLNGIPDYGSLKEKADGIDYILRPRDTEFWKLYDVKDAEALQNLRDKTGEAMTSAFGEEWTNTDTLSTIGAGLTFSMLDQVGSGDQAGFREGMEKMADNLKGKEDDIRSGNSLLNGNSSEFPESPTFTREEHNDVEAIGIQAETFMQNARNTLENMAGITDFNRNLLKGCITAYEDNWNSALESITDPSQSSPTNEHWDYIDTMNKYALNIAKFAGTSALFL